MEGNGDFQPFFHSDDLGTIIQIETTILFRSCFAYQVTYATNHRPLGVDGWGSNSNKSTPIESLLSCNKSRRGNFIVPKKHRWMYLHANVSRIFLGSYKKIILSWFKKHSAQIYVLKNWPQNCQHFVDMLVQLPDSFGSHPGRRKIPGKHTCFPFFFSTSKNSVKI